MIARQVKIDMRDAVEAMLRRIACAAWCKGCNKIVELLTLSEALSLAETNPSTLVMWIRTGRVHCLNTRGKNLICASSIQRSEAVTGALDRRHVT